MTSKFPVTPIAIVAAFLLTLVMTASAWTDAPLNPPNNNLPAPLHVGTTEQLKEGGLGVKGLSVTGVASITKSAFTFPSGNASLLLAVNGDIAAKRYCDITGQNCVTALGGGSGDVITTETTIEDLPDYESDWVTVKASKTGAIEHNLGTDRFARIQTIVRQNDGTSNDEVMSEGFKACHAIFDKGIWGIFYVSDKDVSENTLRYRTGYSGPCYHPFTNGLSGAGKNAGYPGNWTTYIPASVQFKVRIWK